jgi:hypothetical protein
MNQLAIQLTLHGAIVLLIGLLTGIPYGRSYWLINGNFGSDIWLSKNSVISIED